MPDPWDAPTTTDSSTMAASHRHDPPQPAAYNPQLRDTDGNPPLTVHQAMAATMATVTAVGKTGVNREQGYTFRSIDKFMDALNPAMSQHGVHVVPRVLQRFTAERTTKNGARMRLVDLEVAFTFYGPAGDSVVAVAWGEGSDTSDKATNKAMTGAFKYAIVQAFMVPTSDLSDADQHTTDVPTDQQGRANDQAQADASPEVVAELRARALAIAAQPKPDRAKLLAELWKDAKVARALGATVAVPTGWQALVGEQHLLLHQLVTGVKDTPELPDTGEALGDATPDTPPERCVATRDSDGGRCEKPQGHSGRHSYLAPTGAEPPAEPGTQGPDAPSEPQAAADGSEGGA